MDAGGLGEGWVEGMNMFEDKAFISMDVTEDLHDLNHRSRLNLDRNFSQRLKQTHDGK